VDYEEPLDKKIGYLALLRDLRFGRTGKFEAMIHPCVEELIKNIIERNQYHPLYYTRERFSFSHIHTIEYLN
jgi:hypothetical protein